MKFFIAVLFFLCGLPIRFFSQNLQFYREDLTFKIENNYFYVDGIYNFCNNNDKEINQILFYPFPQDSLYGTVDSAIAIDLNSISTDIITSTIDKGIYFRIKLAPYGVAKYKISYRQKLLKNKAEYILTTTQKWDKPFDNAIYKLIIPVNTKIISTSYTPDSIKQAGKKSYYYWTKKNFMPDKNMIFYFE